MDSLLEPEDQLSERYLSSPWGSYGRSATLGFVSLLSKALLGTFNTLEIVNLDTFYEYTMHRKEGVGLITVCNHTSTIDDPVIFSAVLPWSFFYKEHTKGWNRWSLCAREMCYSNKLLGQFFQSGKTLPVERGGGIGQPIMRVAAAEVARGKWLHMFPEGRINYSGKLGPLRWGVGKVVCDAYIASGEDKHPTVLPFYHSGMGHVLPRKGRVPRIGHHVTVLVGQPIQLEEALMCRCKDDKNKEEAWRAITERVAVALRELEAVAPENRNQEKFLDEQRGREDGVPV